MPRGKNYVNNQRGVHLQPKVGDNGEPVMKMCEYGSGCQRPDCIYRHDESRRSSNAQNDVCIPFLAGKCTFEKGCRKRHPSKDGIVRLLARYKKTRCRFGDECYTEGCLFLHPKEGRQQEPSFIAPHHFPPLSNTPDSKSKQAAVSDSAWKKNPPTMVADVPTNIDSLRDSQQTKNQASPHGGSSPTSVQQQVEPKQAPAAWGYPNRANGEPSMMTNIPPSQPQLPPSQQGYYGAPTQPTPIMVPNMAPPAIDPNTGYPIDPSVYYYDQQSYYYHQQQQQRQQMVYSYPIVAGNGISGSSTGITFNAEAKEFVPGMFTA